eukprot:TRINITY_DN9561_c0_g1_i1.p2 TRINITY_DN9561_c0_g1~~TRINITY_DN9561_c0_g1_i1.p2  ORF type:complete len:116 (-),score=29.09 TRINITY_DN9561_c0_g1_i1:286-633(-)
MRDFLSRSNWFYSLSWSTDLYNPQSFFVMGNTNDEKMEHTSIMLDELVNNLADICRLPSKRFSYKILSTGLNKRWRTVSSKFFVSDSPQGFLNVTSGGYGFSGRWWLLVFFIVYI